MLPTYPEFLHRLQRALNMPSDVNTTTTSGLLQRMKEALHISKEPWPNHEDALVEDPRKLHGGKPALLPYRRRTASSQIEVRDLVPLCSSTPISNPSEPPSPLQNCTVLLVDDNAINQVVGARLLMSLGCRVYIAHDGDDAINQICVCAGVTPPSRLPAPPSMAPPKPLRSKSLSAITFRRAVAPDPIDVVLMDYQMPIKDGMTATREIRAMENLGKFCTSPESCAHEHFGKRWRSRLPVIAATSLGGEDVQRAFLEAGVDGSIKKPFTAESLRNLLEPMMTMAKSLSE